MTLPLRALDGPAARPRWPNPPNHQQGDPTAQEWTAWQSLIGKLGLAGEQR